MTQVQVTLLEELKEFLEKWESAEKNKKPDLNFFERKQYSLSEIIELLNSPILASGTGLIFNLSMLEQKIKGAVIIDDRKNDITPNFHHPTKLKLFFRALGQTELKKLA